MARNAPAKRTLSDIIPFSNRVRQGATRSSWQRRRRSPTDATETKHRKISIAHRMQDGAAIDERGTIFFRGECLNCITMQGVAPGMQRVSARRRKRREDRREIVSTKTKTKRDKKNRARNFVERNATTKRTRRGREKERERENTREREGDLIEINCKRARVNSLRLLLGTIATARGCALLLLR